MNWKYAIFAVACICILIFFVVPYFNSSSKDVDAELSVSNGCIDFICFPGEILLQANLKNNKFDIKRIRVESTTPEVVVLKEDYFLDMPTDSTKDVSIPIQYNGEEEYNGKFTLDVVYYDAEENIHSESRMETEEEFAFRKPKVDLEVYGNINAFRPEEVNFLSVRNEEDFDVKNLKMVICTCNANSIIGSIGTSPINGVGRNTEGCTSDPLVNAYVAEGFSRSNKEKDTEAVITLKEGDDSSECEVSAHLYWRPSESEEYFLISEGIARVHLKKE